MNPTWAARITILLVLGLIYFAGADRWPQRCQQHPVFHSNLKP